MHLHQHRSVQRNVVQDSRQLHLHEHRNLQQSVQLNVGLDPVDVAQQARAYEAEVTNQARAFEAHVHNQAAAQTELVRHEMSAFLEQFKHEALQRERERESSFGERQSQRARAKNISTTAGKGDAAPNLDIAITAHIASTSEQT